MEVVCEFKAQRKKPVKILLVCRELPSPSDATSLRVLYALKYLPEKYGHDITMVAFQLPGKEYLDLTNYCRIEAVNIPCWPGLTSPKAILYGLRKLFSLPSISSWRFSFFNYSYSPEMDKLIKTLLDSNKVDIMIVNHPSMLCYALNKRVPTVLLESFALSEIALTEYKMERNWLKKIIRLLYYYQTRNYAKVYEVVNLLIAVSTRQRDRIRSHCPNVDIAVIPGGADTDYLKTMEPETKFPSLAITGTMSGTRNKTAILYFYNEVYPLIKERIPRVKLYIVGSNPEKEILRLSADKSVTVTGYVKDLRPYLSRAWVVVAPLQEDFGVKIRVLQAMAVGKPVVSTSMGATGISVSPGENIILADEPGEFADRVIELLNDKQLRQKIGAKARLLMETEHSWENLTDKLNVLLEKVAKGNC
jgi:glycosyltransferase involved in cell wall biosynthesis